ncbi:hypothetical protein GCM10010464_00160 [Pseudonocardia yunnanensis]
MLAHREKAETLSTRTLQDIKSILRRAITRARARDKIKRNVVLLCETPTGQVGRPSKALTLPQAQALVDHATGSTMGAYALLSLLTGARTEELRALTWNHVNLDGNPHASPPVLPHMMVWRSVRAGGDTKTRTSRRTLALPQRCIDALREHQTRQPRNAPWPKTAGQTRTSSSPPKPAPHSTPRTCGAASAESPPPQASTPKTGHHASYATASCPYCPTRASPSNTSPAWSDTPAARPSPRPSTANNSGP